MRYSSLVIDHLKDMGIDQHYALAFMYFDYREHDSQSPNNVVAHLLRQIASQHSVLPRSLSEYYTKFKEQSRTPQLRDIENVFMDVCRSFVKVYVVVDALDECNEITCRRHFLQFLSALQECSNVRIFVTSRPHPEDIQHHFNAVHQIEVEASEADLRKYLRDSIEESSSAAVIDDTFKQHLIDTIAESAQNM